MNEHTTPVPVRADEIGPFARALRAERRLTLREAAGELGVSVSALSQAERGEQALHRLALRSVSLHFDQLVSDGLYAAGKIEERIQVVGGMINALARHKGTEVDRRASLFRQALLARKLSVEQTSRFILVRLDQDTVMVDLPTMDVLAWLGRPDATLDNLRDRVHVVTIVDTDSLVEGMSVEVWADVVDRFADALAVASASGSLDIPLLRTRIRPEFRDTSEDADPFLTPNAPMTE